MRDETRKAGLPTHQPGTQRGEDRAMHHKEPGRVEHGKATARYATSIDPESKGPIDPKSPYLPPA